MQKRTYLIGSALGAAAVVNAHRPFTRDGAAVMPVFASGLFDSELPLARAGSQLVLTAAAARSGLLRSKAGVAATALNVATIAGALHLEQVARQSPDVLEAALVDELGGGYRQRIRWAPAASGSPVVRRYRPGSMLAEHKRYVAKGDRSLAYGTHPKRNLLDVWRRADLPADGAAPVLVQVHGGAWVSGNKRQQAMPLLAHLSERGWVCVDINYRLSPKATWPDLIVDVLRAVAWTKENIARYGGDPGFVAITGGSAGGHLSALAALAAGDPEYQPGFESADTQVQAAVPLYGVYDWLNRNQTNTDGLLQFVERQVIKRSVGDAREVFERASPLSRIRPDAPPFFVLHGSNDAMVHVEQAREFAEELRKVSANPVAYAELPLAQHAFDGMRSTRAVATAHAVERFLGVIYGEYCIARQ